MGVVSGDPAAGALSDTRVDGSAHRNSPKPTQMARALDVLITDKPPVLGTRTLEEEKDARLAHLEQKRYDAAARNRRRRRPRVLRRPRPVPRAGPYPPLPPRPACCCRL